MYINSNYDLHNLHDLHNFYIYTYILILYYITAYIVSTYK